MAGYLTPAWSNNAAPAIDATALSDIGHGIEISEHPYGVCATTSSTAAKVVTVDYSGTLTLFTGLTVRIKFSNKNAATNPTLNVNGTGAVPIIAYGSSAPEENAWVDGETVTFVYDGTNWVMDGGSSQLEIVVVTITNITGTGTVITRSITNSAVTNTHVVLSYNFSNRNAQISTWEITTSTGSIQVSGKCLGTTNLTLVLGRSGNNPNN